MTPRRKQETAEFIICLPRKRGELMMDWLPRGGLLIQVGVDRDGYDYEWNWIELPRRYAVQVQRFIFNGPRKGKRQ